jgi:hypothetical protein
VLTPLLVIAAVLAAAAATAAVAAPNPRHATLGAFAAVLLAGFVADPLPDPAALVARVAGALLGAWLVWTSLRGVAPASARSALGWPGAAGVAAAAFAVGWLAAGAFGATIGMGVGDGLVAGVPGATLASGSPVARAGIAAAAALAVLAAAPVVLPRDGHRMGLGALLLLTAGALLVNALGAGPDNALEVALGIGTALAGAAVAAVTAAMVRGGGDLFLRDAIARDPAVRHRPADEAHRGAAR